MQVPEAQDFLLPVPKRQIVLGNDDHVLTGPEPSPADTAAADPALLPQLPVPTFHGLRVVMLSNHVSPHASSPVAVFTISTAPATPDRAL